MWRQQCQLCANCIMVHRNIGPADVFLQSGRMNAAGNVSNFPAALDHWPELMIGLFQRLAVPALAHRVQLGSEARYGGETAESIVAELVAEVPVPL